MLSLKHMGGALALLLTLICCVPCSVRLLLLLLLWCLQGTKLSVNDFVLRAAALALRDTPAANAFWDKGSEAAVQQPSVDVCVAVATEGGLITPIVKAADTKSLMQVGFVDWALAWCDGGKGIGWELLWRVLCLTP